MVGRGLVKRSAILEVGANAGKRFIGWQFLIINWSIQKNGITNIDSDEASGSMPIRT